MTVVTYGEDKERQPGVESGKTGEMTQEIL